MSQIPVHTILDCQMTTSGALRTGLKYYFILLAKPLSPPLEATLVPTI